MRTDVVTEVQTAINYALAQVGKPYQWGATGPNSYDCSGLVYMAYKSAGVGIPRVTGMQQRIGVSVAASALQPGDLVFPDAGHVVMYIGSGRCVEAPHTGAYVRVIGTPTVWKARRVVGGTMTLQQAGFLGGIGTALRHGSDAITGANAAVQDAIGLGGVGAAAEQIPSTLSALASFASFVSDTKNWYRAGMFLLGVAFMFLSLRGML